MATLTMLVDDFDRESEAVETVQFSIDGKAYEIDLCQENVDWLRETMAPVLAVARRAPKSTAGRALSGAASTPVRKPNPDGRAERMAIREWARANGYPELSNQGVIPQEIKDKYAAAH